MDLDPPSLERQTRVFARSLNKMPVSAAFLSRRTVLLLAAAACVLFFRLGSIPLWSSDEGRYGMLASGMYHSRDFVVPQFNGVTYLEKPVLASWLTLPAYAVFGIDSFSTRLPVALAAFGGLLMTYFFVRRLFERVSAELSLAVLAASVGYVLVGRFAVIDMFFNVLVSGALFSLMAGFFLKSRRDYLAAYVFMGLAFLAKGLAGIVLPLLVFLVFLAVVRNLGEIKNMLPLHGLCILAVITLPWFIAMCRREPQFFDLFIVKHHFARFAQSRSFGRSRPVWFYLPILLGTAFPWSFFIPASFTSATRAAGEQKRKALFLLLWFGVIFIFFSASRSKLPYYILPVGTPLAVLTALFLRRCFEEPQAPEARSAALVFKLVAGVLCAGLAGLNVFLWFLTRDELMLSLRGLAAGFFLAVLAAAWGVLRAVRKGLLRRALDLLLAAMFGLFLVTAQAMQIISPFQSTYDFAQALKPLLQPGDRVGIASSPDNFSDFPFHLGRRVMVVSSDRGTLEAGSRKPGREAEMREWFKGPGEFVALFNAGQERFYLLTDDEKLREILAEGLKHYAVVKRGGGKILLTNRL